MKLLYIGILFPIFCSAMQQDEYSRYLVSHDEAKNFDREHARTIKIPEYLFMNLVLNAQSDPQTTRESFARLMQSLLKNPVKVFNYVEGQVQPEKTYIRLSRHEFFSGLAAYVREKPLRSSCSYSFQVRINGIATPIEIGPNFGNPMFVEAAAFKYPTDDQKAAVKQTYQEILNQYK